jgi:hypothetical protein
VKLEIDGKQYDLEAGMARSDLYTLFELKSKYGIGMQSMLKAAQRMEGLDPMELLEDAELFQMFLAMIWLARRHAGEKLTLEEAASIPLTELRVVNEEEEVADPADPPQALTDSAQGAAPRRASTSRGTSKTSKSR